jgi:hypothetical protein
MGFMKFGLSQRFCLSSGVLLFSVAVQCDHSVFADSFSENIISSNANDSGREFEFETLAPDQPVFLPEEGKSVSIRFGLRITNRSKNDKKFLPYEITPKFLDKDRKMISPPLACARSSNSMISISVNPPFKVLRSGESLNFVDQASLHRQKGKYFIEYSSSNGDLCRFDGFNAGEYSTLMHYKASPEVWWFKVREEVKKDLWMGEVHSLPVLLVLMKPH